MPESSKQSTSDVPAPDLPKSRLSIKKRCANCRAKRPLLDRCKYCDADFCFSCIQFEIHACEGYERMRDDKKGVLSKRLNSERCDGLKVILI